MSDPHPFHTSRRFLTSTAMGLPGPGVVLTPRGGEPVEAVAERLIPAGAFNVSGKDARPVFAADVGRVRKAVAAR